MRKGEHKQKPHRWIGVEQKWRMTTMATLLCSLRLPPPSSSSPIVHRLSSSRSTAISMKKSKLSSSTSVSGFPVALPRIHSPTRPPPPLHPQNQPALTVVAAKGYKMKTHKASAKRFRVTGRGKIVRRRAWKQHLLSKKTTKRKLRLSKMATVNRSDYDNVIGALPYLKVNRHET